MKNTHRKQKALSVMAFAIYMAGLLSYWMRNDGAAVVAPSSSNGSHSRKREGYSHTQRTPSSQGDTLQPSRDSGYLTEAQQNHGYVREEISDPAIIHEFWPTSSEFQKVDYRAEAVDQISVRSTSDSRQKFTQLFQEIVARSHEEHEALRQIGGLALKHPEAPIRELAVAFLAESGNDLAINFLIDALTDTDLNIRQLALHALYRLEHRVPIESLVDRILNNSDGATRAALLTLIRRLSGPEAVSQIEMYLQTGP